MTLERSHDVHFDRGPRVVDALAEPKGRQMKDVVHAAQSGPQLLRVGDAALEKPDPAGESGR